MKSYKKNNKLKYKIKDSPEYIYDQIKIKANQYFGDQKNIRRGKAILWFKAISLVILLLAAYYNLIHASSFPVLAVSFFFFGFIFLIIGINIGHDAAHHCLTGSKRLDNFLFQLTFGLQGLSGYVWQIRHNFSHHVFPNVYGNDTDMELSKLILLSPHQKKLPIHKYQHLYAPFLYMTFSLAWIFYIDFHTLFKKKHANIQLENIPAREILKVILIKIVYLFIFIFLPLQLTHFSFAQVFAAYLIMNFLVSLFLAFTFFISHHVLEAEHAEADNSVVPSSWIHHQIVSTVDFSTENMVGNYIFGGFNLHIAHHIFPDVCHVHYPALTRLIRKTLEENNLSWYKSSSFFEGVLSHLSLLKRNGSGVFEHKPEMGLA